MDRLLYISTVGAANIERAQALHANNLANVSTTGFRADLARAESRWVEGDGHPARVYGVSEAERVDLSSGVKQATGRMLDIAVEGEGFIAVELPEGGEGFTRDGALRLDSLGRLYSSKGLPVLGEGGPIALPPFESIVIGGDGVITVQPEGQGPDTLVQVDRIKLVNPPADSIEKGAHGLMQRSDDLIEPPDANVKVVSGFLESSNVNAVNEMTEILSLARQFEIEVRMMQTAQQNDEAASQLLRVG